MLDAANGRHPDHVPRYAWSAPSALCAKRYATISTAGPRLLLEALLFRSLAATGSCDMQKVDKRCPFAIDEMPDALHRGDDPSATEQENATL